MVEFELASHVLQDNRILFFDDILRQVDDLEDTLETDHRRGEFHRRAGKSLQGAIELTEIRAKRNNGSDGEDIRNDKVSAKTIDERRPHCTDQTNNDEKS